MYGAVRSPRELFSAEHFLQQRRRLGGRVFPDLRFFLAKHVEQAVQSLAHNVLIEIELPSERAATRSAFENLVVLLHDADLEHGAMDDRREGGRQIAGAGPLEVVSRRRVATG